MIALQVGVLGSHVHSMEVLTGLSIFGVVDLRRGHEAVAVELLGGEYCSAVKLLGG